MKTTNPTELTRRDSSSLLIDVRTPAEFREFHVAGAENIPLDQLKPETLAQRLGTKDAPVYFLCRSGSRAKNAGELCERAGFTNIHCVDGGSVACRDAGVPITEGRRSVISLERQVRIAAGSLVLVGLALGALVGPAGYFLSGFIGCGLIFAGVTDWCGMGLLLSKAPWNR